MNRKGFTLIEMLMVVFIIATLLILTIPNIVKHKQSVDQTSCDAYAEIVETQAAAYKLITGNDPTMSNLISEGYLTTDQCGEDQTVSLDNQGHASVS